MGELRNKEDRVAKKSSNVSLNAFIWVMLLTFTMMPNASASTSWDCIVSYGCSTQYAYAHTLYPATLTMCARASSAGTIKFSEATYLTCLMTYGSTSIEVISLVNCIVAKC